MSKHRQDITRRSPKNGRGGEVLRLEIREYKGVEYVDFRIYYEAEPGEWRPTKKGVTFSPDLVPEVAAAFETLRQAV